MCGEERGGTGKAMGRRREERTQEWVEDEAGGGEGHEGAGRAVRNGTRGAEEESGEDRRWKGAAGRGGRYVCTCGTRYEGWGMRRRGKWMGV